MKEQITASVSHDLEAAREWNKKKGELLAHAEKVYQVENDDQLDWSGQVYTAIGKHIKELEKERKEITGPIDKLKADIMQQEKQLRKHLEHEHGRLKALNDNYATARQERIDAERKRVEAEAQRLRMEQAEREMEIERQRCEAEKERLVLEAEADKARDEAERKQKAANDFFGSSAVDYSVAKEAERALAEKQAQIQREANHREAEAKAAQELADAIERENAARLAAMQAGKATGNKVVTRWDFEMINKADVPRSFLMLDEKSVREYIKYQASIGQEPKILGIKFASRVSVEGK